MTAFKSLAFGMIAAAMLPVAPAQASDLTGTTWRAVSFSGGTPPRRQEIRLAQGGISGSDGCNRFRGSYKDGPGNRLRIESRNMASTMMACDPAIMRSGRAFFEALESARTWRVRGTRLYLIDRRGREVAVFRR